MENIIVKKVSRNCSIDIFRIICAIMIVAIHTNPFKEINGDMSYFINQILARIAVPFFFCISGYYYIKKIEEEPKNIKENFNKTFLKLLIIYVIWSIIYFIKDIAIAIINKETINIKFFIDYIKNFFVFGSSYHLWFFPALFFSIIVMTIAAKYHKIKELVILSIVLYLIGCLGCSYYEIGNKIPIIKELINLPHFTLIRRVCLMGLPFFSLGFIINKTEKYFTKINNKKIFLYVVISIIGFFIEIFFVIKLNLQYNIFITVFLYVLLFFIMIFLLKNPMSEKKEIAKYSRGIANFIYYSHPIFILIISKITTITTIIFAGTVLTTFVIGLVILKLNCKILNRIII